jgi:hypothetical protein
VTRSSFFQFIDIRGRRFFINDRRCESPFIDKRAAKISLSQGYSPSSTALEKGDSTSAKTGSRISSMQSINAPSALRENGWKYLQPGELPERVWETGPWESSSIGSPDASFAERYVMGCPELLEFGGQSKIPAWKWALSGTFPWFETFLEKVRTNRQEMDRRGSPCVPRMK